MRIPFGPPSSRGQKVNLQRAGNQCGSQNRRTTSGDAVVATQYSCKSVGRRVAVRVALGHALWGWYRRLPIPLKRWSKPHSFYSPLSVPYDVLTAKQTAQVPAVFKGCV